jgi:hypothetical protein
MIARPGDREALTVMSGTAEELSSLTSPRAETVMRPKRLEYRKRAFDYLDRAKATNDSEQLAEMLSLAKMWFYLSEEVEEMPGHYELPKQKKAAA